MQPAAPAQPNTFERLLPTIGSVGGGIVGGVLGAGAGAAVPGADLSGVPEIAGGVAGAGAGGAIGQGLGKTAENLATNNPLLSGVVGNALTGGVSNALGAGVGSALGAGVGALAGGGGKLADIAAAKGPKLLMNQVKGGLSAIKGDVAGAFGSLFRDGVTDARDIPKIAQVVTGSNGILSKGVRAVAASAGQGGNAGVDTSGLVDIARHLLTSDNAVGLNGVLGKDIESSTGDFKAILNTVNQAVNASTGEGGHIGLQLDNGSDAFGALQQLEKKAANQFAKPATAANGAAHNIGGIYRTVADELEGRIFNNVPVTDEVKASMIDALSPLKDINPTYYNNLVSKVSGAVDGPSLRAAQAPLVKANQVYDAAQSAADIKPTGAADIAAGAAPIATIATGNPLALAGVLPRLLQTNAADRIGANIASKLAGSPEAVVNDTLNSAPGKAATKIAPLLTRIGQVAGGTIGGLTSATPAQTTTPPQSQGGLNVNPLQQQMTAEQGAANALLPQAEVSPTSFGSSLASTAGGLETAAGQLAPQVEKLNILSSMAQNLGTTPGGLISFFSQFIPGSQANLYNQRAESLGVGLGGLAGVPAAQAAGLAPRIGLTGNPQGQTALQGLIQALGAAPAQSALPAGQ